MRHLKPVSRVTLGEQVALQLADLIHEGRWKTGEKLPSEGELCTALSVGRSTVREALKSLAFVGMVQMRPGEGTYVAEGSTPFLERLLTRGALKTEQDLADVWEARMVLETELASLAAGRATDKDMALLDSLFEKMEIAKEEQGPKFSDLDLEFHLALAGASQNRVLFQLLSPLRGMVREWIEKSQELPGLRENAHLQHRKIFEAVREKNPEKARKAMEAHLQTFQRAFTLLGKITDGSTAYDAEMKTAIR
jgi:GntR family transcriptional regulator, transcriptional repressor for pyruvate dehydrogenase complex